TACATTTECCGDDCSGLASWAIDIYASDPFDVCCDTPCKTPVYSCSGVGCPVDCVTDCLPTAPSTYVTDGYYVLTTLLDEVGNKVRYYATLEPFTADFLTAVKAAPASAPYEVVLVEYNQDKLPTGGTGDGVCSWFCIDSTVSHTDTGEYGFCSDSPDNVIDGDDEDLCAG
ncbi:MAG: hypothetical protein KAH35_07730, partial [Candidatus Atribacteria bacterium]|nr:hypothetical protein [Candidatus Atribacteria bacterium]